MKKLVLFLMLFFPAVAGAQTIFTKLDNCLTNSAGTCTGGTKLSAVACNAAAASRWTGWMAVATKRAVRFDIDLVDANSDETSIDMRCETSRTTPANDAGRDVQVLTSTSAAGVTTSVQGTLRETATGGGAPGTSQWQWTIENFNAPFLNCLFTCNGAAAAADTLTVFASGVTP